MTKHGFPSIRPGGQGAKHGFAEFASNLGKKHRASRYRMDPKRPDADKVKLIQLLGQVRLGGGRARRGPAVGLRLLHANRIHRLRPPRSR